MCCNELKDLLAASGHECFDHSNVAKENGKEFRIKTLKKLCRVKNDGCLNKSQAEKKCDFIFKICDTNEIILVELKGEDVELAVTQIRATYNKIYSSLKSVNPSYKGFIISSSVPAAAEQKFRQLKEKCRKDLKFNIDKKHFKCEISI